jgi:hypothetical protein
MQLCLCSLVSVVVSNCKLCICRMVSVVVLNCKLYLCRLVSVVVTNCKLCLCRLVSVVVTNCKLCLCRLVSAVVTIYKLHACKQFQIVLLSCSDAVMGIKTVARWAELFNNYQFINPVIVYIKLRTLKNVRSRKTEQQTNKHTET